MIVKSLQSQYLQNGLVVFAISVASSVHSFVKVITLYSFFFLYLHKCTQTCTHIKPQETKIEEVYCLGTVATPNPGSAMYATCVTLTNLLHLCVPHFVYQHNGNDNIITIHDNIINYNKIHSFIPSINLLHARYFDAF